MTPVCDICTHEKDRPAHKRGDACAFTVVAGRRLLLCVDHAYDARAHETTIQALLRPTGDHVLILRDRLTNAGYDGRIIIPDVAKDWLGRMWVKKKKNDEPHLLQIEVATGWVLGAGPGAPTRKYGGGIRGPWSKRLAPMTTAPGMHIIFRAAYEAASTEWRGLTILHDFDVLGEVDEIQKEGAAQ